MTIPRPALVVALLVALVIGGLSGAVIGNGTSRTDASQAQTATQEPLVQLVQQVGPAVVTVVNLQTVGGLDSILGGFDPDSGQLQPAGSGTGFIISQDGYIVTNWHVVTGGDEFQVSFADGTVADATLIGSDQTSDLAVVQVEGQVPGVVGFGDSDALLPGQGVIAIGSPLGAFDNTVTEGIVSATNRDFPAGFDTGEQSYTNLIQHDAVINPGNSGGPLFNLAGEVIGVNTLGIPAIQGQPVQGLFFAIPSNEVRAITDELIATGQVIYPLMGVSVINVTPELAAQYDLPAPYGGYIESVEPGGPAEEAGMQAEDIVIAINGQAIDAENGFTEVLFNQEAGATVPVTVQRGDEQVELEITLGERQQSA